MRWPSTGVHEAMHGDEVQVSLVSAKGKTPLANVRFVLTRATQTFFGVSTMTPVHLALWCRWIVVFSEIFLCFPKILLLGVITFLRVT